jgi:ribonuclease HI
MLSTMGAQRSVPDSSAAEECLDLVLHTAVSFVRSQGVGIGITQRSKRWTARKSGHEPIPAAERKYGIKRGTIAFETLKTPQQAQMLALVHALGLAHGTVKRGCPKAISQLREITVFAESSEVVQTVNYHMLDGNRSCENVTSTLDRLMIKRVIAGAKRLLHRAKKHLGRGVKITIALHTADEAGKRARALARQKGRQACKSRRQLQSAHARMASKREGYTAGVRTLELAIRTKEIE